MSGMNSPILKENIKFLTGTSLLILLLLSACSPGDAATPVLVQDSPTEIPSTPLPEATKEAIPAVATPEVLYPFYLPFVTKLENTSQTIDGVTVQIDWVYVDEARVAIAYTVSGLDWPDGSMSDPTQQVRIGIPSLSDSKSGGFSGAGSGNVSPVQQGRITASSDQALSDGVLDAKKTAEINLNVAIPVEGPTKIGIFHFNFNAPVANGDRIENIDQTVVANNVSMTLKSIVLNPSHAEALICFQMPSSADWGLTASTLTVGGREYPFVGGGLVAGAGGKDFSQTGSERCSNIGFDIVYDETMDSLTLTVPKLMGSVPEVIDQKRLEMASQRLADKGIEFNYESIDHGGRIIILKRPDGATDEEIYPLIWEALAEQYEGPWVFTVPIR